MILCLLLLALPAWGQEDGPVSDDRYEWVIAKVDSSNLGHVVSRRSAGFVPAPCPDATRSVICAVYHTTTVHEWVNGEIVAMWSTDPFLDRIGERKPIVLRERICRICKRHEWQERREKPKKTSEFDQLKEQLRGSIQAYTVIDGELVSVAVADTLTTDFVVTTYFGNKMIVEISASGDTTVYDSAAWDSVQKHLR